MLPALTVKDLDVSFRNGGAWHNVVRNLSFDVNLSETVALVGESGSGKSVTSMAIMRLLDPEMSRISGEISVAGQPVSTFSEKQMQEVRGRDIGMIFQEPMTSLNPTQKTGYQIAEVIRRHRGLDQKSADAETLRILDLVRIPDGAKRMKEYPHSFSGGMRQRVMIAMALACQPKLLIADEPTTALDVTIQAQVLQLIRDLQKDIGMGVLFVTHDMGVVAEIADRVVVMCQGDKIEDGTVEDIFKSPKENYTRMLLRAVPELGTLGGTQTPRRFPDINNPNDDGEPENEPDRRQETLLKVDNLSTRFPVRGGFLGRHTGNVHAVEDVSFELRHGETLALVGESGCGKSTTGRSIIQLQKPSAGQILFDDQPLSYQNQAGLRLARQNIQMIFQDPYASLNPRKTVGAAIAEPMLVHGLARHDTVDAKVHSLLERVGLEPSFAKRYPHQFSGGQRQRVCIARSLAMEPKIIIADESVSALDASIKAQVVNLMLDLQRDLGLAFLFISHDLAVVERISHRIAVMYLGQIVEIGPRNAILSDPQHPYTRRLLDAVPVPDPQRKSMRRGLIEEDLHSPVRPLDWQAPVSKLVKISDDHWVRKND